VFTFLKIQNLNCVHNGGEWITDVMRAISPTAFSQGYVFLLLAH
jgi:hypothetical protein